mmetsp:Transcript_11309/g.21566  ORF Transcript_11309/g.21566 Transcript_11309/m.21566 type:complete len:137 (-) Transcript_11309:115-525(-)
MKTTGLFFFLGFLLSHDLFVVAFVPRMMNHRPQPRPVAMGLREEMTPPLSYAEAKTAPAKDVIAQQTAALLKAKAPRDLFANNDADVDTDHDDDTEDDEIMDEYNDDMDPDYDPAKQIFNPCSFWTERSGRFPRRK